jgi:hypothetical protein
MAGFQHHGGAVGPGMGILGSFPLGEAWVSLKFELGFRDMHGRGKESWKIFGKSGADNQSDPSPRFWLQRLGTHVIGAARLDMNACHLQAL